MKLYLSTKPLLNSDSAAVTSTVMFMAVHIFENSALTKSPLVSVKNFLGAPKIWMQLVNFALMITFGSFDGMKVDADIMVTWSIRWRRIFFFENFWSIATHS